MPATGVGAALHYLTISDLAPRLRCGDLSPVRLVEAQLERIAQLDPMLNAYATVLADDALAEAEAAAAEIAAGRYRGPLHGVPIAAKDLIWTKDRPTAAGMPMHRAFLPPEDATLVRRLRDAGTILLGKMQLTEGAYSDHHPAVTPPRNPWNAAYWTGISSSGSAVATAAGLTFGSIASDTGGSIRWPCAANGITGLKPSYGRVSRHGVFALAPSLDHIGPVARSARDAAILLKTIAGSDPNDPTALLEPVPDYPALAEGGALGLRIGLDPAWNSEGVDAATQAMLAAAAETFRALGANIVELSFPDVAQSVVDWVANCAVEAALVHEATFPARRSEYGPVLAGVLDAGRALGGLDYQRILERRMAFRGRVAATLAEVDLLLTPVQPFGPLSLERIRTLGEQPELIAKLQRYTCPFNMTGHPTITLPGGFADGMPIAFQLVAPHLGETTLLSAGAAFQEVTSWHREHPLA